MVGCTGGQPLHLVEEHRFDTVPLGLLFGDPVLETGGRRTRPDGRRGRRESPDHDQACSSIGTAGSPARVVRRIGRRSAPRQSLPNGVRTDQ